MELDIRILLEKICRHLENQGQYVEQYVIFSSIRHVLKEKAKDPLRLQQINKFIR
jgi:hypothetical protein